MSLIFKISLWVVILLTRPSLTLSLLNAMLVLNELPVKSSKSDNRNLHFPRSTNHRRIQFRILITPFSRNAWTVPEHEKLKRGQFSRVYLEGVHGVVSSALRPVVIGRRRPNSHGPWDSGIGFHLRPRVTSPNPLIELHRNAPLRPRGLQYADNRRQAATATGCMLLVKQPTKR